MQNSGKRADVYLASIGSCFCSFFSIHSFIIRLLYGTKSISISSGATREKATLISHFAPIPCFCCRFCCCSRTAQRDYGSECKQLALHLCALDGCIGATVRPGSQATTSSGVDPNMVKCKRRPQMRCVFVVSLSVY